MTNARTGEPARRKPLRLWPGVALAGLVCLGWFVLPVVLPDYGIFGVMGAVLGGLGIAVWWVFFSRAPWPERLGAVVLTVAALYGTSRIIHESIATGMMGMMFVIYPIPALSFAFVVAVVASRRLSDWPRRTTMVVTILLACGAWTLVRTGGMTGGGGSEFAWRWTETPEERLLAQVGDELPALPPAPAAAKANADRAEEPHKVRTIEPVALPSAPSASAETIADWPGFRGPGRDSAIPGVRIETDWSQSPPVELWRRPIGPGWSSFAVRGGLIYTQEQRGDDEVVTCYNATTGELVWIHRDSTRFWESNAGAGPRATPALSGGRLYTFGATGILNALDARDGSVLWSRSAAADTEAKTPIWGFASSPLVVGDLVIVYAGQLVAYDLATGEPRWSGPARGISYSSPHLVRIDEVEQVLLLNGTGAVSVAPTDGTLLWEHSWLDSTNIVQPALTADGDVLIAALGAAGGIGTRRIAVAHRPEGWTAEERWTSIRLKPYFNDFVVHDGHAFGFDGSILACIELKDGKRKWKGGRYGNGQLILLPDQDLLLVLSEQGDLVLVSATPGQFTELARFPAIEGKTWNHPVLVGDLRLVRNGEEMVAFRLILAGS